MHCEYRCGNITFTLLFILSVFASSARGALHSLESQFLCESLITSECGAQTFALILLYVLRHCTRRPHRAKAGLRKPEHRMAILYIPIVG